MHYKIHETLFTVSSQITTYKMLVAKAILLTKELYVYMAPDKALVAPALDYKNTLIQIHVY